ncbi:MAG: glycosyltransferase [Oscillospiraceae bacterium]|nr:glycosyltransferase [Oscillospiraceae bacterium]
MKKPSFSVLISVYGKDEPEFLSEALESIFEKQTAKPDEIITVFDGPLSPELHRVLDDFRKGKEDFVRFVPLENNVGLGEALRIGTDFCSGDYIFRMDSDDISVPERFEKQMLYAAKHPETDVFGTDIAEFESNISGEKRIRSCPENHSEILKMSRFRCPMNHMSVCIKKSALIKSGGYKPLFYLEDYYLWIRMLAAGCRFGNINETLVFARTGNGFYSRRSSKKAFESRKFLLKFMVKKGMISPFEAAASLVFAKIFISAPEKAKALFYKYFLRS